MPDCRPCHPAKQRKGYSLFIRQTFLSGQGITSHNHSPECQEKDCSIHKFSELPEKSGHTIHKCKQKRYRTQNKILRQQQSLYQPEKTSQSKFTHRVSSLVTDCGYGCRQLQQNAGACKRIGCNCQMTLHCHREGQQNQIAPDSPKGAHRMYFLQESVCRIKAKQQLKQVKEAKTVTHQPL